MIAGIGRTWVDEILHAAKLSPFKRGDDLSAGEAKALRKAMVGELQRVLDVYEEQVALPLPEKFPKPTKVHAHQGEPCPRCETVLEAVFYEDYVMSYCPHCQTEGRILKDRRLSRLLEVAQRCGDFAPGGRQREVSSGALLATHLERLDARDRARLGHLDPDDPADLDRAAR